MWYKIALSLTSVCKLSYSIKKKLSGVIDKNRWFFSILKNKGNPKPVKIFLKFELICFVPDF